MDSESVKIVWIDDDKYTELANSEIRALSTSTLDVEMTGPIEVDDPDFSTDADLYLLDYKLDQHPPTNGEAPYKYNGATISTKLRQLVHQGVPIYLVSRIIEEEHSYQEPELADRFIARRGLAGKSEDLYNDALDYKRIRETEKNSEDLLISLLMVPESDVKNTLLALPVEIRNGIRRFDGPEQVQNTPDEIIFGKWVIFSLLQQPGVTYDDLYAATYLGMDVEYFRAEVVPRFEEPSENLKYKGVFSKTTRRRWWKQALSDYVVSAMPDKMSFTRPWLVAPKVFSVPENVLAKCVVCGGLSPETVGRDVDDKEEFHPVHIKCSEVDPDSKVLYPFEQIRLLGE